MSPRLFIVYMDSMVQGVNACMVTLERAETAECEWWQV